MNKPSTGHTPLYLRIAEVLRTEVTAMSEGETISTERELMERFGVSRGTIRQAIAQLVKDGLLVRTQGSGTFRVLPKDLGKVFYVDATSIRNICEIGKVCGYRSFSSSLVRATNAIADALELPRGTKVRKVCRIRTINGRPFAVGEAYARADLLKKIPNRITHTSLVEFIREKSDLHLYKRRCICSAVAASRSDAEALDVPVGTPLMQFSFSASATGYGPFIIDVFRFIPEYQLCLEATFSPVI